MKWPHLQYEFHFSTAVHAQSVSNNQREGNQTAVFSKSRLSDDFLSFNFSEKIPPRIVCDPEMATDKGKAVAVGKDAYGKRKRNDGSSGVKPHNRKRKNRSVLQFVEDAADVDYDDDDEEEVGNESDNSGGFADDGILKIVCLFL